MSAAVHTVSSYAASPLDRLSALREAGLRWLAAWRARRLARATYLELMELDDRSLADIGLSRGQIGVVAASGVRPSPAE